MTVLRSATIPEQIGNVIVDRLLSLPTIKTITKNGAKKKDISVDNSSRCTGAKEGTDCRFIPQD
jgi:hypothetical protein